MNEDVVFLLVVLILAILFAGDPDLMDAIMYKLTEGKIAIPAK